MPTTKSKSTKKAAARSGRSTRRPVNAELDNSLFVPRLDLLQLPESSQEGSGPEYGEMLESICGAVDDSQAVEQYDGTLGVTAAFVAAHERPVAQVQWNANLGTVFTNPGNVSGVRWGSGTMIGRDLFLTAGHLFDPNPNGWTIPRTNGTSNAISPQTAAQNMHLNFNFQVDPGGNLRAEQSFPILSLSEYRLNGLDVALCVIGGNPGDRFGWSEFATVNAAEGEMLAIIGHPAGQPKRIEAGPLTDLTGSVVRYDDIDTLGGNSGSGILQASTGRVIGVHTNGGCNTPGVLSNSGVAIAAIVAASPTLQALTPSASSGQTAADIVATFLARDVLDTVAAADLIGSRTAGDTGLRDQIGTRFSADVVGTANALDTGLRDQLGTLLSGDIGTFGAGDDPDLTRVENVVDPGRLVDPVVNPAIDPARNPAFAAGGLVQRQRPFVQAGPSVVSRQEGNGGNVSDAVLAEVEQLMLANAAIAESLQAVHETLTDGAAQT